MRSRSYIATPPGATVKEQLLDRGMSQKEFALRMNLSEKHVSKLINGDVQLTPEVAVRLEMVLGVPAKFWNNLESIYREKLIKIEAENSMDEDEILAKQLPYSEMAKLGWVPDTKNMKERVYNLRKYFEVVELTLLENRQITRIACRSLDIRKQSDLLMMAWIQEAKIQARNIKTAPINTKGLLAKIPEIRNLTVLDPSEFCPILKKTLTAYGIALVFLPHLKGTSMQGVSFFDGNKIVMGFKEGKNDVDAFWQGFFRELAHIILGHIGQEDTAEKEEMEADYWARNTLISEDIFIEFSRKCDYSASSVRDCALRLGIATSILVGRLQSEGCINHSMLNDLKEHYDIAG